MEKSIGLDVDSKDVVRLILQFLKENNLLSSMRELQKESGVSLNCVENTSQLINDVLTGRWDLVLSQVSLLQISQDTLLSLYEQVVLELIEMRDVELAKELLRTTDPFIVMKSTELQRYLRLEHLCSKPFSSSEAYMNSSKEARRKHIADSLFDQVSSVPQSRLLSLIGQALKFQQIDSSKASIASTIVGSLDLFSGDRKTAKKEAEDKFTKTLSETISFTVESHPSSVNISPNGEYLITGSADGFVEVWDVESGKLRVDLEYQAKDELMMHTQNEPILCCSFNKNNEHFATGGKDGQIKVWNIADGVCVRKLVNAHTEAITSIAFLKDPTHLITTSLDQTARVHGLKSGRMLKEFRGHSGGVNTCVVTRDNQHVITGSVDGTCKLWDFNTVECLVTYRPGFAVGNAMVDSSVHTLLLIPQTNAADLIFACSRSYEAQLMTIHGKVIRTYSSGKQSGSDFTSASLSAHATIVYCGSEDGNVYGFDVSTGELEGVIDVADGKTGKRRDIVCVTHHSQRNVLVTCTSDGTLSIWRP